MAVLLYGVTALSDWYKVTRTFRTFPRRMTEVRPLAQSKRKNRTAVTRSFSMVDATKANLANKEGPWRSYPGRMRQMRARGFALRDSFADVLKGISIAEEAMDTPIENVDVKKQREAGTLDLSATLSESQEPNRGHADTGLQRSEPPKKQEDIMCGKCAR